MDRAEIVHENFVARVRRGDFPECNSQNSPSVSTLSDIRLVEIFHSQVLSRHLDLQSRQLQKRGQGYYTIGSSGHEGGAAIAAVLKPSDMAFLHYRDAAFQIQRSRQIPGQTPLWDMLLSFVCSSDDPISGGRHKVLGSKTLNIPPQTSTIASHLPKAVGAAYSISLRHRLDVKNGVMPKDAIVVCTFGDASLNHSTAQGAINTAAWTAYQGSPMPLLFVCEDNGIGISTRTPRDWIRNSIIGRAGLAYYQCDGLDVDDTYNVTLDAASWVRKHRQPAFLHFRCVRLYGHAGADVQSAYMTKAEIEADESNDPILYTARLLRDRGIEDEAGLLGIYENIGRRVARAAEHVVKRPKLRTATEVMKSIIPPPFKSSPSGNGPAPEERAEIMGTADMAAMDQPLHMAKSINLALTDLMLEFGNIIVAGEDVGPKGGVYGVTQRLHDRFGPARVINTLLDEQSILGLGIGLAHNGILPILEIQFLAYLHNAEDQLRGEASTLSFFSNGQFTNPMIVRIAGLGYQRGFGGHFHNDNSLAVLLDIPGIIVACPSNARDAVLMLRESVRLAKEEQRIIVFVEPIALYMTRDLHEPKDTAWSFTYPKPGDGALVSLGEVGIWGDGSDLAIVTYGNGTFLSCQAKRILEEEHGIQVRVVDLRWLAPLPSQSLEDAISGCSHVLIVDECRISGSQSAALMAFMSEHSKATDSFARIAADDSFIPTGPSYAATLPSRESIVEASRRLVMKTAQRRIS